jgi:hypothetical protein
LSLGGSESFALDGGSVVDQEKVVVFFLEDVEGGRHDILGSIWEEMNRVNERKEKERRRV